MDWTLPPPPPAFELRLAEEELPLPDLTPTRTRASGALRYERRWKKARVWSAVSLGFVGLGAGLEGYTLASLLVPSLDDGVAPLLAGTYGGMALVGGSVGLFVAEAVGNSGMVRRPGGWGLLVSGVGLVVTAVGAVQTIQTGSEESVVVLLSGPLLVGAGAVTQYALGGEAAASGFRAAVVPTGNGAAVVGTF